MLKMPVIGCSGCGACANICPKNCIEMKADSEGFLYPNINIENCINCSLCEKVCPVLHEYKGNAVGKAYACINKDEAIRLESSSGGVFTPIAEDVIAKNGVVFGAELDSDFTVRHEEVKTIDGLSKLRGSKYVQSNVGDSYKKIKKLLDDGELVLFTGTPCQISGLKMFLGKNYENLILQDIICHGVPSPKVWDIYKKYRIKSEHGSPIQRMSFRHKKYGWKTFSVLFKFLNNTEYIKTFPNDLYMRAFLSDACLRPSCYNCHSKSLNRQSDITLADFWGIENVCPEMFDDKGTSLVFINSEKGALIFDSIKDKLAYKEVDINEAVKYNVSAHKSVALPPYRKKFFGYIQKYDFDIAVKKVLKTSVFKRAFNKLKRTAKKILRFSRG